ncbi:MAG: polysaccharide export protein [Bryobacterales bacterium]|nr:polysaccharide export protein [Bryobacterales bacterium]
MLRTQLGYAIAIIAFTGTSLLCDDGLKRRTDAASLSGVVYVLGPADQVEVWALGAEEISGKPLRIDAAGYVDVPTVGRLKAGGLTLEQFKGTLVSKLQSQLKDPQVTVSIVSYGSEPVSVIGAVNKPGVYQLEGPKTLLEVLSLAGGLSNDAGSTVRILRAEENTDRKASNVPAPNERTIVELNLESIVEGSKSAGNILIQPNDVISISRAKVVYVAGSVHKPGGFSLGERDQLSILQLLSLAEGLNATADAQRAKVFHTAKDGVKRSETSLNVRNVLEGKGPDAYLEPEDVLFIPDSKQKGAALRAAEIAIQMGTGVTIWRAGGLR